MTYTEAKRIVKSIGLRISKTEFDEYRVAYASNTEASAYYTSDLVDAVETAQAMKRYQDAPPLPPVKVEKDLDIIRERRRKETSWEIQTRDSQ